MPPRARIRQGRGSIQQNRSAFNQYLLRGKLPDVFFRKTSLNRWFVMARKLPGAFLCFVHREPQDLFEISGVPEGCDGRSWKHLGNQQTSVWPTSFVYEWVPERKNKVSQPTNFACATSDISPILLSSPGVEVVS
jgi:hypothetical protein